jgi:fructoselysine 6-phosphate deglycase
MGNSQVNQVLEVLKNHTVKHVFFVACGGSSALMYPSKYVMDVESATIPSDLYSSNEFIHRNSKALTQDSVVILCSHSGTTPETVEAAKFARSNGALTVSLTHVEGSALALASDYTIGYKWGEDIDPAESNFAMMYRLVLGLLSVKEGNIKYEAFLNSMTNLKSVYNKALDQFKERGQQFGQDYKDEKVIYTMASGANYGPAYSFAICILMEMQWIHSHAIHAGEYFHGPFEIIDKDVPFIILLGLDETRPLEERALEFSQRYGDKLVVLDAKEFDMSGIDDSVKGYIAPLVLNRVLRSYANMLADARNHPLTTRRYMWKVAY